MPLWHIGYFELKLLEKQSMKKQTNKKIQHIKNTAFVTLLAHLIREHQI